MSTSTPFTIAERSAIQARVAALGKRGDDVKSRVANILKQLWVPERELIQITDVSKFTTLRSRFPNFSEVIDLWEGTAIGLSKAGLPFQSAPILLAGDPGVGKTFFASEAASALGLPYFELSMATATAGFVIAGGSIQWGEGEPGFVAKSMAESPIGNPMLLIDEIDKSHGGRYSPLGPFFPLLEPHSACRFKDEALELELNASKVIWVATANEPDDIPPPILSRMRVFHIEAPKRDEMPAVIRSVYQGIRQYQPYGHLLDQQLNDAVLEVLTLCTPRQVRQRLEEASLRTIRDGHSSIQARYFPAVIEERSVRYGFL